MWTTVRLQCEVMVQFLHCLHILFLYSPISSTPFIAFMFFFFIFGLWVFFVVATVLQEAHDDDALPNITQWVKAFQHDWNTIMDNPYAEWTTILDMLVQLVKLVLEVVRFSVMCPLAVEVKINDSSICHSMNNITGMREIASCWDLHHLTKVQRWYRYTIANLNLYTVEQKSIGLKFSKSQTGSHVTYICHHNSSCFTFPIFAHSWHFSVFHSWLEKEGRELPKAENWPGCDNTVINPELSEDRIPLPVCSYSQQAKPGQFNAC